MIEGEGPVIGRRGGEHERIYGLLAEFEDVDGLLSATEQVRDAGFRKWDVHTPFPVHGLERAMGLRPTVLPWLSLLGGLTGLVASIFLVWWTNATSFDVPYYFRGYEFLVSAKPLFSLPANIPIIFEVTVLLSAFGAFGGFVLLSRLPWPHHPLLKAERFRRASHDRFFIVVEALDPRFDRERTAAWLEELGARAVEAVEH